MSLTDGYRCLASSLPILFTYKWGCPDATPARRSEAAGGKLAW
ncbi:MAG: hypothetical protein P8Z49_00665 [Acidobacteriota bacterium]